MTFSWPSPRDSETEATARPPPHWQIYYFVIVEAVGWLIPGISFLMTTSMFSFAYILRAAEQHEQVSFNARLNPPG
jgi:hypothetical protein